MNNEQKSLNVVKVEKLGQYKVEIQSYNESLLWITTQMEDLTRYLDNSAKEVVKCQVGNCTINGHKN